MAHIHRGAAGTNGPVEVNLAFPQDGQPADCLTEGEADKGLAPGEVQQILVNPSAYYVNVRSTATRAAPGGPSSPRTAESSTPGGARRTSRRPVAGGGT